MEQGSGGSEACGTGESRQVEAGKDEETGWAGGTQGTSSTGHIAEGLQSQEVPGSDGSNPVLLKGRSEMNNMRKRFPTKLNQVPGKDCFIL